jgi:membrane carboxypeptidase/penicillin-binding protein PbpC
LKPITILIITFLISSCNTIQYSKKTNHRLPELGVIGNYKNLLLEDTQISKTILPLQEAIVIKKELIEEAKRKLFTKDSLPQETKTSIKFSIIDKMGVVNQINNNSQLLENLKLTSQNKIVTEVKIAFPKSIENTILQADEVYLVQEKESTLSLQLRNNNKVSETISFSEGTILDYKASQFCWGKSSKNKIEIFDLVPSNSSCGEELYNSATKAKKKTEFKF